jgi:hypothetical protein
MPEIGTKVYLGNTEINATGLYLSNDLVSINSFVPGPPQQSYVTNGLILYMDSTVADSYPGTGTNWYNLVAGYNYTGSLAAGASYVAPYLQTQATTNSYINVTTSSWYSLPYTIMCASRYTTTASNGRMLSSNNNWLLGHWNNSNSNYYAEGTIYGIPGGANNTDWNIYAGTGDQSTDTYSYFLNGSIVVSGSSAGSGGPVGLNFGSQNLNTEFGQGQACFIMVYNRILSEAEVLQNYNALKSEVGL